MSLLKNVKPAKTKNKQIVETLIRFVVGLVAGWVWLGWLVDCALGDYISPHSLWLCQFSIVNDGAGFRGVAGVAPCLSAL